MDKIKRYIETYIDTETCNLRCHYCYIKLLNKFDNKLVDFPYSPKTIAKALSKERLGGVCLFNLCAGGETLLAPNVIPVVRALLEEGHYVMVVTNGTLTHRFKEFCQFPAELIERLIFKFSFHYLELKKLNWIDLYFNNVSLMRDLGASFTVEITPNDELIPYIDELKKVCMDKLGTLCHVTIARDDRTDNIDILSHKDWETYQEIWNQFDSELFRFKSTIFYKKRKEFCYAGEWSIYLNLMTGDMSQCYCGMVLDNIYKNINKPLHFEAIGCNCMLPHCYNGHAFLTLGDIPEMETVTYAMMRNRVDINGKEWLQPKMKTFLSQKLIDNNQEYDDNQKRKVNRLFRVKYWSKRIKKIIRTRIKRK